MTVEQLISALNKAPNQQAEVCCTDDDGEGRNIIEKVMVHVDDYVLLIDNGKYMAVDQILKED